MMRHTARLTATVLVAVVASASCSSGTSHLGWASVDDVTPAALPADATVRFESDGVSIVTGHDPASPTTTCQWLVLGDVPYVCVSEEAGGFNGSVRSATTRVVWLANRPTNFVDLDRFVVWSSASPGGRVIEPIVVDDVEHLVWIMEPGEAPWGYQMLDASGRLLSTTSLVGLPAE